MKQEDVMASSNNIHHEWRSTDDLPFPQIALGTVVAFVTVWPFIRERFVILSVRLMKYEILRHLTLLKYPRDNKPSSIDIAVAGFYFHGHNDSVVCFCCGLSISGMTGNDCPISIHRQRSPMCPLLLHNEERNIRFFPGTFIESQILQNSSVDDIRLEQVFNINRNVSVEREYDRETFQDQNAEETRECDIDQPSFSFSELNSLPDPAILGRPVGGGNVLHVNQDNFLPNQNITVGSYVSHGQEIDRSTMPEDNGQSLDSGGGHLVTDEVISINSSPQIELDDENSSAAEGGNSRYRSTGSSEREVSNIESAINLNVNIRHGNRIRKIHRVLQNIHDIHAEQFQNIGFVSINDINIYNDSLFIYLPERLQSFNYWEKENVVKVTDLAVAGFSYTGHQDSVKCFRCNLSLGHWEAGDVPWLEHAKYSPDCQYVIENLGPKLIRAVVEGDEKELEVFKKACLGVNGGTFEGACAASNASTSRTTSAQAKQK